jgi:hypothetical protein
MLNWIKIVWAAAAGSVLVACSGGGGGTGGETTTSTGTGGSTGTGTDGGTCVAYVVPSTTNLMTPTVTLKAGVMPVFNNNCGSTMCHGTNAGPPTNPSGLFLGASTALGADSATVHAAVVGKTGKELSSMPLVTAGDPSKSYLMHKMDGDQCLFNAQCALGSCDAVMPNGLGHVLPVTSRDTVRRWIAQGAKND